MVLPFWTSFLVRTFAMIFLLRDTGLINAWLLDLGLTREPIAMLYTPFAVVTGLVYGFLPFMILPIYASLEKLDRSLLEAAEVLGARPAARFRLVTLPLSMPGVVAGCLLVFVPALGSFLTADLLGGAKEMMIGNLVQNQFSAARNWPFGSAASFIVTTLVQLIPTYLRDAQRPPRSHRIRHIVREAQDLPWNNMQSLMLAHFFTLIKEQLHAHANSKEGQPCTHRVQQRLLQL